MLFQIFELKFFTGDLVIELTTRPVWFQILSGLEAISILDICVEHYNIFSEGTQIFCLQNVPPPFCFKDES